MPLCMYMYIMYIYISMYGYTYTHTHTHKLSRSVPHADSHTHHLDINDLIADKRLLKKKNEKKNEPWSESASLV